MYTVQKQNQWSRYEHIGQREFMCRTGLQQAIPNDALAGDFAEGAG